MMWWNQGILVSIATEEQAVYIATGQVAHMVFSDDKINEILDGMMPMLRSSNYSGAIELAVCDIKEYLKNFREKVNVFCGMLIMVFALRARLKSHAGCNAFMDGQGKLTNRERA